MATFKFRLEKILEHREMLENIKKGEFAKAQANLRLAMERLQGLKDSRESLAREKEETSKDTTMKELQIYNKFMTDLEKTIEAQEETIKEIQEEVEDARAELIEATKDKKIIEKLKFRDYQEYLYEEKKEEEKVIDQFVSYSSSTNVLGD